MSYNHGDRVPLLHGAGVSSGPLAALGLLWFLELGYHWYLALAGWGLKVGGGAAAAPHKVYKNSIGSWA
jgi:hypothetical protein